MELFANHRNGFPDVGNPRDVTETDQEKPKAKPIHNTWAAWKANPIFPIRVIVTHIMLGGEKNEKEPSWMLLTPMNDFHTRRYIYWDRALLEKFNLSVGQICDIIRMREVPAFSKVTLQTIRPLKPCPDFANSTFICSFSLWHFVDEYKAFFNPE